MNIFNSNNYKNYLDEWKAEILEDRIITGENNYQWVEDREILVLIDLILTADKMIDDMADTIANLYDENKAKIKIDVYERVKMSEEEKRTLDFAKKYLEDYTGKYRFTNEDLRDLVNLIEKQEKVIDKMAESMTISDEVGVENVKKYFYKEIENE